MQYAIIDELAGLRAYSAAWGQTLLNRFAPSCSGDATQGQTKEQLTIAINDIQWNRDRAHRREKNN